MSYRRRRPRRPRRRAARGFRTGRRSGPYDLGLAVDHDERPPARSLSGMRWRSPSNCSSMPCGRCLRAASVRRLRPPGAGRRCPARDAGADPVLDVVPARLSITTASIPSCSSSRPSVRPAGPAPTMPTWVLSPARTARPDPGRCRRRASRGRSGRRGGGSWRSETTRRAPLIPSGCPIAIAPPFTFTFEGSRPSSRMTATLCEAKASFSSTRSMSSTARPARRGARGRR